MDSNIGTKENKQKNQENSTNIRELECQNIADWLNHQHSNGLLHLLRAILVLIKYNWVILKQNGSFLLPVNADNGPVNLLCVHAGPTMTALILKLETISRHGPTLLVTLVFESVTATDNGYLSSLQSKNFA